MTAEATDIGYYPVVPQEEVLFGPMRLEYVAYDDINVMSHQVRSEYDGEALEELADAMVHEQPDGTVEFELINPLLLAKLDPEALTRYLNDHGEFYGVTHDPSEFTPADDGYYYVQISGHRRMRAINRLTERFDLPTEAVRVASVPYEGIAFDDALVLQIRENVHLRPHPIDEARTIERYKEVNPQLNAAQIARRFGFADEKVRDALRFAGLPDAVKKNVAQQAFTYGNAVRLSYLQEAYRRYYQVKAQLDPSVRDIEETVDTKIEAYMFHLIGLRLKDGLNADKINDVIKGKVNDVLGSAEYITGELFVLEEDTPAIERDYQRHMVTRLALRVLGLQVESGGLSRAQTEELIDLTANAHRDRHGQAVPEITT